MLNVQSLPGGLAIAAGARAVPMKLNFDKKHLSPSVSNGLPLILPPCPEKYYGECRGRDVLHRRKILWRPSLEHPSERHEHLARSYHFNKIILARRSAVGVHHSQEVVVKSKVRSKARR